MCNVCPCCRPPREKWERRDPDQQLVAETRPCIMHVEVSPTAPLWSEIQLNSAGEIQPADTMPKARPLVLHRLDPRRAHPQEPQRRHRSMQCSSTAREVPTTTRLLKCDLCERNRLTFCEKWTRCCDYIEGTRTCLWPRRRRCFTAAAATPNGVTRSARCCA